MTAWEIVRETERESTEGNISCDNILHLMPVLVLCELTLRWIFSGSSLPGIGSWSSRSARVPIAIGYLLVVQFRKVYTLYGQAAYTNCETLHSSQTSPTQTLTCPGHLGHTATREVSVQSGREGRETQADHDKDSKEYWVLVITKSCVIYHWTYHIYNIPHPT